MSNEFDYWGECIAEAFEDAHIKATKEQIELVSDWVRGAYENYGLATGEECIPNPLDLENKRLATELKREQNKTICPDCNGSGSHELSYLDRISTSTCSNCNGSGFIYQ